MRLRTLGWVAVAGTLVMACNEEKAATPKASAPAPATAAATGDEDGDLEEVEATPDDIQTAEDFEDEAEASITPDNLESELDKLEAEIGG